MFASGYSGVMRIRFCLAILALAACGGGDDNGSTTSDAAPGGDSGAAQDAATQDAAPPAVTRLMYVSTGNGQTLAVVQLEIDGTMTALSAQDVDIGGNTGALAYARSTRRLYLGVGNSIETLSLDAAGVPTSIGNTPNTGSPTYIAPISNDAAIATVYFGDDRVASHTVTGDPPHARVSNIDTDVQPHAAIVGPGARLYVPHRDGQVVRWFSQNAGALTLEGEIDAAAGVGPRHAVFAPSGSHGYVVNEQGDSVTAYTVGSDGALSPLNTITTLPVPDPGNTNNCADIHITPDGKFVYASNRGDNSIAMFSVGSDGNLAALGNVATEATPREFEMSPDGRYIVVAGQGSGFLQSYSIGSDGMLTALTTGTGMGRLEVGGDPRWVIID